MGLDLWFQEDVARILASVHETMLASTEAVSAASAEGSSAYRQGFQDSLRAVAVAFGVAPPRSSPPNNQPRSGRVVQGWVPRLPTSWEVNSEWKGGNNR